MNLRQFFSDPAISLPIIRSSNDFQGFVDGLLETFLNKIGQLVTPIEVVERIQSQRLTIEGFCKAAKELVRATLAGHPRDAYQHFESGITPLVPTLLRQELTNVDTDMLGVRYRVRPHTGGMLTREGLFHIPFESRHLVKTQRYSIPGLPCLYLGGSLYTCWAEMGRPPFHELHAAAFWLNPSDNLKILNLGNRPARLLLYLNPEGDSNNTMYDLLATHISLWLLLALCSIKTLHREAAFKPEYILPQIVLQWITKEHTFDGLCYFSTHVEAVTKEPLPPCNLVFPARAIKPQGRCARLRELFKMTDPHQWELLRAVNIGEGTERGTIPTFQFEFINGRTEWYHKTDFGNVQQKLNSLAHEIRRRNAMGEPDLGTVAE